MSVAKRLSQDTFVMNYGHESTFRVYYTCIPRDDMMGYECLKGKFDTCYSNIYYDEKKWKEVSIPKVIPLQFHSSYISKLNNADTIIVSK